MRSIATRFSSLLRPCAAVLLALLPAAAAAAPDGVRLLPISPTVIRFTVDVPPASLIPLDADANLTEVTIAGHADAGFAGAPALPARILLVAVPPVGEVRVRAAGSEADVREGVLVAPMPRVERGAEADRPRYVRDAAAYAGESSVAPARARLLGVSWMRNQRVARVEIAAADYTPAARRLTLYRRVDVEVEVQPSAATATAAESPDPFEDVYRSVLVNYEQGRSWRRPAPGAGPLGLGPLRETRRAAVSAVPQTSVFAGRRWVKIAITRTGFYKVDFGQIRNTAPFSGATTIPTDSLRLFSWPGFPVLPEESFCDSCDYREVAIAFSEDGNRIMDQNSDAFYFFALGPSDWADYYDPSRPDTVFINNPYDARNYVYLTVGSAEQPVGGIPKRILTRSAAVGPAPGATTPATFRARAHLERDVEYFPDPTPVYGFITGFGYLRNTLFWEKWYWRSISRDGFFSTAFDAPGVDVSQPFRLRLSAWGISAFDTCFFLVRPPNHLLDVTLNATALNRAGWNGNTGHVLDTTLTSGLQELNNTVQLAVPPVPPCALRSDRIGFAWLDVFYQRRFRAMDDTLTFESPAAAGDYVYRVDSLRSATPPRVFDVTDAYAPLELTGLTYAPDGAGGYTLTFESAEPGGPVRYRVISEAKITKVPVAQVSEPPTFQAADGQGDNENLRSPLRRADFVVIYYDAFRQAADSLAAWRRQRLPLDGVAPPYEALAIPVSVLFDQFSGGRIDPSGIRNFLHAAFNNWARKPAFVTVLGDASFDFKNILGYAPSGQPGTLVPSYEGGFDLGVQRQFATDDWLLNVDTPNDVIPDFFGGRVPAGDAAAALVYVRDKLLPYERSAPLGDYRDRVMLIADDDKQGSRDDPLHWLHVSQTTALDTAYVPRAVDRAYVYLHTYPDGPGDTKPAAKEDIKRKINDGVAMFNYIGHGSPFKIADEGVFLDTDSGTLANASKLTVFVAASCDVGKFNDPTVQSLGERLVLKPGGGAIGVISATELAFSNQNAVLNQTLYQRVFDRNPTIADGQYHTGFAPALLAAKQGSQTTQKYQLMGDAGLRLNLPLLWAEMTLWDSAGTTPLAAMNRGQTVLFRGRVLDREGGVLQPLDGEAAVLIEDAAPYLLLPPCRYQPGCTRFLYYYTAGPIFRGQATVRGGSFEGRFVVPLEAREGPRARTRAYLTGRGGGASVDTDGAGSTRLSVAPGSANSSDVTGPVITLSFTGGATVVRPTATLRVDLFDPSGILTTGYSPQNGIILTLDDNTTTRFDITSSFQYNSDSYQAGTASFELPNLSHGTHRVTVSAADNLAAGLSAGAHRSLATLEFEVVDTPPLRITSAFLFPNPTQSGRRGSGGHFIIDAPGDSVNVRVRLYTVSGKLIRSLTAFGGLGQIQVPWDGLDAEGAPLANGVYLYQVHVSAREPDGKSSAREKAQAEGRVVIVNR
ncbi:MAG: hypothetical protein A2W00_00845 [Candidatus Eisenbacteria bacterium RBG_16_71_46]|nr:MAG: hypothetical protein A2W00_00845 [Candidatus Eisenbacteria bacterium RBG_16_71_46]